jgi:hypothetical protein
VEYTAILVKPLRKVHLLNANFERTCVDRCSILNCKLKHVITLESHIASCIIPIEHLSSPTPTPSAVSKALNDFPNVLVKYPGTDDDQSIKSLAHLPCIGLHMSLMMRLV